MALRRELASAGFDAGAVTIHFHLSKADLDHVPSVSTIWRILKRRGFAHVPSTQPSANDR